MKPISPPPHTEEVVCRIGRRKKIDPFFTGGTCMQYAEAEAVLRASRLIVSEDQVADAIRTLIKVCGGSEWIRQHPEVTKNPLCEGTSMGIHGRPWDTLMPHRTLQYEGRTLYISDEHVEDLLS